MTTEKNETVETAEAEVEAVTTPAPESVQRTASSVLGIITLILVLVAFGLMAWFWVEANQRFVDVEQSLSNKLNAYQGVNQQGLILAKQAEERSAKNQAKTLLIEEKLAVSQSQQAALQTLFNQLSENRETAVIAEVEQLISIANQQLRVTGNVKSALLALQAADEPLEALNLPRATALRAALGNDIASLRQLPQINMLEVAAQLESLSLLCEQLPLVSEREPIKAQVAKQTQGLVDGQVAKAQTFMEKIWETFAGFVTIERIDAPEAPLLTVDHRFYLRENLKLRMMTARIALLQRDEVSYLADLNAVKTWLGQYYDMQHPNAEKALVLIEKLSAKQVNLKLPELHASLEAIQQYKALLDNH